MSGEVLETRPFSANEIEDYQRMRYSSSAIFKHFRYYKFNDFHLFGVLGFWGFGVRARGRGRVKGRGRGRGRVRARLGEARVLEDDEGVLAVLLVVTTSGLAHLDRLGRVQRAAMGL